MAAAPALPPPPLLEPSSCVAILTALDLTPALLAVLEAQLVRDRNRFVCLQFCTMAREACAAAQAAVAAGDAAGLARSAALRFALMQEAGGGGYVAGCLFYPRGAATSQLSPEQQHVYIELLVCAAPRRGHASSLLAAVEAHVAASPGAFGHPTHLRLLSVASARQFWECCGFSEPDKQQESSKPLAASRVWAAA